MADKTAWTGFGDYVESLGSKPSGQGNDANFELMLAAAMAKDEEASESKAKAAKEHTAPLIVTSTVSVVLDYDKSESAAPFKNVSDTS